ncbi:hypothetical protein D3C73_1299970 [compost metagenome]
MLPESGSKADPQDVLKEPVGLLCGQPTALRGEAVEDRRGLVTIIVLSQNRTDLSQEHLVPSRKGAVAIESDQLRLGIEREHQ